MLIADSSITQQLPRGLVKSFGDLRVLKGIDLKVAAGEVVVIVGPSGSGKSTLLNCINFLEPYEEGIILVGGNSIGYNIDPETELRCPQRERELNAIRMRIEMVFQHFNLFPHMTALGNVSEAPIHVKGVSAKRQYFVHVNCSRVLDLEPRRTPTRRSFRAAKNSVLRLRVRSRWNLRACP